MCMCRLDAMISVMGREEVTRIRAQSLPRALSLLVETADIHLVGFNMLVTVGRWNLPRTTQRHGQQRMGDSGC